MPRASTKAPRATPTPILIPEIGGGENNPYDAKDKEITVTGGEGKTDALVEAAVDRIARSQGDVARRWEERVKREGTTVFYNPFDTARPRQEFTTKRACAAYIKRHHPNQALLAKKEGKPYEPIPFVKPPKRRPEDFYDEKTAQNMKRAAAARAAVAPIIANMRGGVKPDTRQSKLLHQPMMVATGEIPNMSVESLQTAGSKAHQMGKRDLVRAIRNELKQRGVKPEWA